METITHEKEHSSPRAFVKQTNYMVNQREQKLYYQCIPKDLPEKVQSIVILLHGFSEHCERYDAFMRSLSQGNVVCYAFDQHGHGCSEGVRGYCKSFNHYVDDTLMFIQHIQKEWIEKKHVKYFLVGISFGGLVALYTVIHKELKDLRFSLNGLILVAPCLGIEKTPLLRVKRALSLIVDRIAPRVSVFQNVEDQYLTRDPNVLEEIRMDPLTRHKRYRVHSFIQINSAYDTIYGFLHHIGLPILFTQSKSDKVAPYQKSLQIYDALGETKDKEFKTWEGLYHDILHEPEKEQVIEYIGKWITKHLHDPIKPK